MRIKLSLLIILSLTLLGCGKQLLTDAPFVRLKGVSLSPKSTQSADLTDFFTKAVEAGSLVSWSGDWIDLCSSAETAPYVVADLASSYNYIPLIECQFFTQSTGQLLRPLDDATKQLYIASAESFAAKYQPDYLAFGIEVNILYESSTAEFDSFVQLFSQVYDAVKARSPATKVFTVFQLEKMKGLNGGLYGGTNDASANQWSLLDRFPKSDLAAFTTYPGLIYQAPADIPADYYTSIKNHTAKPIAFTELGWHSTAEPVGWESDENEQKEFVTVYFNLTRDLKTEFDIWSFLYDPDTAGIFKSMGLYNRVDGAARPAWDEWLLN